MVDESGASLISSIVDLPEKSDTELEDETLAAEARARFRSGMTIDLEPGNELGLVLRADEHLLAIREGVEVERLIDGVRSPVSGLLAITDQRLLLVDGQPITLASIDDLEDATLVAERLLVTLTSGVGLMIDARHPRLLRVELAGARARLMDDHAPRPRRDAREGEADQPRR